jgi:hypothetical protein
VRFPRVLCMRKDTSIPEANAIADAFELAATAT